MATDFVVFFEDIDKAIRFVSEPFFSGENGSGQRVSTTIARIGDEYLTAFMLYHHAEDSDAVKKSVAEVAQRHEGRIDGEEAPEPEPEPEAVSSGTHAQTPPTWG
jgi:hypothetical protein